MNGEYSNLCAIKMAILCVLLLSNGLTAESKLRPMNIHLVPQMGLEVWTELEPLWLTKTIEHKGRTVFTTQTPLLAHPPAAMTVTSFGSMRLTDSELLKAAESAFHQAANNFYAVPDTSLIVSENLEEYGALTGYATEFDGTADGEQVSVKVFLGHSSGDAPVLLVAYTLKGKLDQISENIRRTWSNIQYLD